MSMRTKLIGVLGAAVMIAGFVGSPAAHATGIVNVGIGPLTIENNANGVLNLDGTTLIGDFTPVVLNGAPQLTTADIQPFTVIDADGTGAGWTLTLDVPQFVGAGGHVPGGGWAIPPTDVGMDAPLVQSDPAAADVAWGAGSPIGTGFHAPTVAIVTSAADQTSMGQFTVSPLPLRLLVPINTYDGTYTSAATLTLASQ